MKRKDSLCLRKSQKPLLCALKNAESLLRKILMMGFSIMAGHTAHIGVYLVNSSIKMPVNFYQATKHHIPEASTIHNHYCENFKSNIIFLIHHCII
jgi:hypothetical protein